MGCSTLCIEFLVVCPEVLAWALVNHDAGIDILNRVQISAAGMDLRELKQEFGSDLVFWGGGVDTQGILGDSSPDEIQEHVRRNIEALAPGGGFVFAAIHDTQAKVPPENIMAMWEAWREYGLYS